MNGRTRRSLLAVGLVLLLSAFAALPVLANHAWGNYHWARTSNPFTIKLGDNVSSAWDSYLRTASTDWSKSTVLDTTVVTGQANSKNCRPTSGRAEICNATYGNNGWLGIAQIWASGSHITQGVVKMNDTYFNTPTYNTSAWRNLVMCQEVGHIFGLAHQDENFDNPNLGTCMDYTSNPGTNQHPNSHDYTMLEQMYSHTDSTTTISTAPSGDDESWGDLVHESEDGGMAVFEKDEGNGVKKITHVFYVPGRERGHHDH